VQQHAASFVAHTEASTGSRLPRFVKDEFDALLECGILAYGFACARCPECGHDFLVAFSCKGWGLCPSCNARRMAETAAHLVDTEMACVCGIHYMTCRSGRRASRVRPLSLFGCSTC
jgi:hypothetical protein